MVLANLEPGALHIVAERVAELLGKVIEAPNLTGEFQMGGLEILTASHTYGTVLDTAQRLSTQASPGTSNLSTI